MDSAGRFVCSSAAPCRSAGAGAGGGTMLLFGSHGGFLGGSPAVADVEDGERRNKRPFLATQAEELIELQLDLDMVEDLYEQGPETTARKRRLTAEQVRALERSFEEEKRKLEPERKSELAQRLGIAPRQVAVWFQNRRARWKTKQLEQDFDRLRAAHDELLAGRDALVADNESLRAQVILLTEKLQANEKSPAPGKQAAVPAAHATVAAGSTRFQLEEGSHFAGTATGSGAMPAPALSPRFAGGADNDSPVSYLAGARSPPSSSEDDCGGDEGPPSVFLPDAVLVGAGLEHAVEPAVATAATAAEEAAQLNSWAWFWN